MTPEEVRKTLVDVRRRIGMRVNVATDAGCIRFDPGLTCIDQSSLRKPAHFPDPIQAIRKVCGNISSTDAPVACDFGKPAF